MDNEEMEDRVRNGEELVHYGILGMKWGVSRSEAQLKKSRKKPSAKATAYKKAKIALQKEKKTERVRKEKARTEQRKGKTKARLDTAGGSLNKANANAATKAIAAAILIKVGGTLIGNLSGNASVAMGMRKIANLTTIGVLAGGVSTMFDNQDYELDPRNR